MTTEQTFTTTKQWQYKDLQLEIIKGEWPAHIKELAPSLEDYHCGYVTVPFVLPDNAIYEIDVHGGITYDNEIDGNGKYGFDCSHVDDTIEQWHLERVIDETQYLADQLLQWKNSQEQA